jgi:hypothetical protein
MNRTQTSCREDKVMNVAHYSKRGLPLKDCNRNARDEIPAKFIIQIKDSK